jgi:hypothetical protein
MDCEMLNPLEELRDIYRKLIGTPSEQVNIALSRLVMPVSGYYVKGGCAAMPFDRAINDARKTGNYDQVAILEISTIIRNYYEKPTSQREYEARQAMNAAEINYFEPILDNWDDLSLVLKECSINQSKKDLEKILSEIKPENKKALAAINARYFSGIEELESYALTKLAEWQRKTIS